VKIIRGRRRGCSITPPLFSGLSLLPQKALVSFLARLFPSVDKWFSMLTPSLIAYKKFPPLSYSFSLYVTPSWLSLSRRMSQKMAVNLFSPHPFAVARFLGPFFFFSPLPHFTSGLCPLAPPPYLFPASVGDRRAKRWFIFFPPPQRRFPSLHCLSFPLFFTASRVGRGSSVSRVRAFFLFSSFLTLKRDFIAPPFSFPTWALSSFRPSGAVLCPLFSFFRVPFAGRLLVCPL